jgi:hypothetical protein
MEGALKVHYSVPTSTMDRGPWTGGDARRVTAAASSSYPEVNGIRTLFMGSAAKRRYPDIQFHFHSSQVGVLEWWCVRPWSCTLRLYVTAMAIRGIELNAAAATPPP